MKEDEDLPELKGLQVFFKYIFVLFVCEVFSSLVIQDSLSHYFTPSNRRRSRVAQSSFSLEKFNAEARSTSRGKSASTHNVCFFLTFDFFIGP